MGGLPPNQAPISSANQTGLQSIFFVEHISKSGQQDLTSYRN